MIKLLIKNYRCFSQDVPVEIELSKGFTSFVGLNNHGKSTLVRFFYEFRDVFRQMMDGGGEWAYTSEKLLRKFQPSFLGLQDPNEIFCNNNTSNVEIEFVYQPTQLERENSTCILTSFKLEIERKVPHSARIYCDWETKIVGGPEPGKHRLELRDNHLFFNGNKAVSCEAIFSSMQLLIDSIYIGPFRNALNDGSGQYFDIPIGTSFIATWDSWKAGVNKAQNMRILDVTEDIRRLLGFDKLEINASSDNKTLQVLVNEKPFFLRELGSGLAQLILVLGSVAIKQPSYVLIDEPESNLHPSLQIDFLTSLASYASFGTMFSTHSIGLARSVSDFIYSVQKIGKGSTVRPFEATKSYAEFLGEMSFSVYNDIGCEQVLLVEGPTDVKTVQQFLRKIGIDHKVVVMHLGGDGSVRGGMEQELAEILRITPKVFALVDSERSNEEKPPIKNRLDFETSCKKLKIDVHLTERRAIENYLSDSAIKSEKSSKYESLGPFEKLGNKSISWSKSENWRIARRMNWSEIESTDIGKFFLRIKNTP